MLCFAGPIGLYLHQPGDPQLNENARSRWRLLQCTMDSKYPEAAGAELIDYTTFAPQRLPISAQIRTRFPQKAITYPSTAHGYGTKARVQDRRSS
jgi:hypothetical protein